MKKPVIVEAERLKKTAKIKTLEGTMLGKPGDWIITGVHGGVYPCKDDIFRETYEPADSEAEKLWYEEDF